MPEENYQKIKLGATIDAIPQCKCVLGDIFVDDLHMIHSVHTIVGGSIVSGTVDHEVVVVFVENQSDRLHNIMVMSIAVNLFAVFVQVEVVEDDLFLLLDGIL